MGDIRMSRRERGRLETLSRVKDGLLTLKKAAELLGLSYRHIRRIFKRYKEEGDSGLIHKSRGKSSNRRISEKKKKAIFRILRGISVGTRNIPDVLLLPVYGRVFLHVKIPVCN